MHHQWKSFWHNRILDFKALAPAVMGQGQHTIGGNQPLAGQNLQRSVGADQIQLHFKGNCDSQFMIHDSMIQ